MAGGKRIKSLASASAGVLCVAASDKSSALFPPRVCGSICWGSRRLAFVGAEKWRSPKRAKLSFSSSSSSSSSSSIRMVYAPPGSGYVEREEETDFYPDTYDPMMEYPGTMRPGRTPENQAYENLPCGDDDPDPVPWPHFQEIEWHHPWEPPHPHPIPMEEFIEQHGRWASVEEEAQMRMDVRRGVRERRELEELEKAGASTLIVDEDEDEVDEEVPRLDLGQGVESLIGAAEEASRKRVGQDAVDDEDEDDEVDFLFDLGLDADDGDDVAAGSTDADDDGDEPAFGTAGQSPGDLLEAMQSMIDVDEVGDSEDDSASGDGDDIDLDIDLDLGLMDEGDQDSSDGGDGDDDFVDDDDDDDGMGITTIGDEDGFDGGDGGMDLSFQSMTLDEYSSNEDMGDEEGYFDDGGFDYD